MTDLFGNETKQEVIRTLGFYQPFGSLMHHGKIETRWVRKGKKPPFPLGKYAFYTTQKECDAITLDNWCGLSIVHKIHETLMNDDTRHITGSILSTGELVEVRLLKKEDEVFSFVKFIGEKRYTDDNDRVIVKVQWALIFKDVQLITPVPYHHGKQGVGFLDNQYLEFLYK